MKAIETEYKGYKFRSRLEARWAVFFDAIGIKWEYEPEGYQFEDGTMYLPDFYLPDLATYVEIKPESDKERIIPSNGIKPKQNVALPRNKYTDAAWNFCTNCNAYWIVFGDPQTAIFELQNYLFCNMYCVFHGYALAKNDKKLQLKGCETTCYECKEDKQFVMSGVIAIVQTENKFIFLSTAEDLYNNRVMPYKTQLGNYRNNSLSEIDDSIKKIELAATKARQARFEHGEHPTKE